MAPGAGHPVASYGFEEAAGDVATDQYGGNDGTIDGATRVDNGVFGRALSFESSGDIVSAPEDSSLHVGSGMTLEAWVKPTAATDWRTVIFRESAGGLDYALYSNTPDDVPHAHLGNNGESGADGQHDVDPGQWTHLSATYDGNLLRLYVDGELAGAKALSGDLSEAPGPLTIGANHVWGEEFRGLIDEVRVYNRALTREEIRTDMDLPVTPGTGRPPADTSPDAIGKFDKPVQFPITPVHLSLLKNGQIAMWDGFEAALNSEHTWDPWTGQFDAVPTGRNLFCAGHITLSDGRLLVAGGHIQAYQGTKDTNLFDPDLSTWERGADMAVPRWYPTATTLPDGRVFVVSGDTITLGQNPDPNTPVPLINSSDTLPEIYNAATDTWTPVPSAGRRMPLYPFIFVLPNGKLFDAGPDRVSRTLDMQTGQWSTVGGTSPVDGQSAVMYRPGKIIKSGTWSEPDFPGREATNRAAAIDMTAANPAWQETAPMKYRRSYHTLTVLPDGKVLATGGQNGTDGVDERTGVLPAEMWDPDTNTWRAMASNRRPRLYHSSSILLPDGRVLLAGGGAFGLAKNEKSGELYSPPYLFKGPRPQISDAPDALHYGQSFTVDSPDASRIRKVSMVRMGNVTHNVDMDQRFMELPMTMQNGSLQVDGPQNANIAPPGWYMVFLIDDNGVPSGGKIVQVDAGGDIEPPTAPGTLAATARTDGADLTWPAATDNKAVTEYRVFRSTTAGFTPSASNRIARVKTGTSYSDRGAPAGTYYYRVRAVDKAGNLGPPSNEASVTVAGDTTAPTVSVTAPTGGTVSATINVSATASDASGVQSVQFQLDGQNLGAADTTSPYSVSWDTRTTTDRQHTLTAVARDMSGNSRTSATRTVRVNNTGVVAAYGFEEASGATAVDAIRGFNGQIAGATRVPDGRFGRALSFDGADDWVTVADRPEVDLIYGGTVEAWVRPSVLGDWRSVITKEIPGALPWALYASSATGQPAGQVLTTSTADALGPAPLGLTTWTHLA
ncbi:MAG: LamG-like jellyroll fold domain-containing protein, partial [Solirubrobacteraceae bacterium]